MQNGVLTNQQRKRVLDALCNVSGLINKAKDGYLALFGQDKWLRFGLNGSCSDKSTTMKHVEQRSIDHDLIYHFAIMHLGLTSINNVN